MVVVASPVDEPSDGLTTDTGGLTSGAVVPPGHDISVTPSSSGEVGADDEDVSNASADDSDGDNEPQEESYMSPEEERKSLLGGFGIPIDEVGPVVNCGYM